MRKLFQILAGVFMLALATQAQITTIRTIAPAATTNLVTANSIQPQAFDLNQFTTNGYSYVGLKSGVTLTNITVPTLSTGQVAYVNTSGVLTTPNGAAGALSSIRSNLNVLSYSEAIGMEAADVPGGVIFDGTSGKYIQGATQTIGTSDFSFRVRFRMPASTPSSPIYIFGLGSSTIVAVQYGLIFYVNNAGGLTVRTYGATPGSDYSSYTIDNLTAYNGQVLDAVFTRTGSTVVFYLNGVAQTLTGPTGVGSAPVWSQSLGAGYIYVGNGSTSGGQPYTSGIYKCQLFNIALTQAEVSELLTTGVTQKWRWGSQTAKYTSDFSGGVDSWNPLLAGLTLTGNATAPDSSTGWYKIQNGTGSSRRIDVQRVISGFGMLKRFKVTATIYNANISGAYFTFGNGGSSPVAGSASGTSIASGASGNVSMIVEVGDSAGPTTIRLGLAASAEGGNNAAAPDGSIYYVKNIVVTEIGCFQDVNLCYGAGYWFPDRSSNGLWVEGTPTGWQHKLPMQGGQYCVVKTLQHSDISSTAETTLLFNLPGNHAVQDIQLDREAGFDAGITVRVGPTGANTKYINDQNVNTTGIINLNPVTGNAAAESSTSYTPVWIKKSGATTTGTTTVRVRIAVKG